ncbi:MAG: hypothetical protein J6W28_03015, partial [Clostridia bacterium]|nr:hypothetical protein [Clostridia bacterium]
LPDYMPEIRRVLSLESLLSPDEPILRTGGADFEGRLLYKLLYTDESGVLTEAPLEGHYRASFDREEGPLLLSPYERIESVSFRPVGPRKLSIRTKVRIYPDARSIHDDLPSLQDLTRGTEGEMEILPSEASVLTVYSAVSDPLEAEFTTHPEGVNVEELRLTASHGDLLVEGASATEGKISLYGTLFAQAVMALPEGEPFVIAKRIPFEAELSADEAMTGDAITAYGLFDGMEIACEGEGAAAELVISLRYRVRATGKRNDTLPYVSDLYAVGKNTSLSRKESKLQSLLGAVTGTASVDGETAVEAEEEGEVLLATLTVRESHLRPFGDKAIIEGEMRGDLIVKTENGHLCEPLTFPFRIEAALGAPCSEKDIFRYTLHPACAVGSISGGRRRINGEVGYTVTALRNTTVALPEAVSVSERSASDASELRIYYPKPQDSLFSVGKAFSLPVKKLATLNDIPLPNEKETHLPKTLDGYAWLFVSDF